MSKYVASKTVSQFLNKKVLTTAIIGPFGSGKSIGSIMKLVKMACEQEPDEDGIRRTRFAIVRNTVKQLKNTTIRSILEWLPDGQAGEYKKSDNIYHFGSSPQKGGTYIHYIILPDGTKVHSEFIFLGLDRPDQVRDLLSLDITGAWINEFREIPFAIFEGVMGRTGRFPKKPSWKGIIMDSNPFPEDSIWYKIFVEEQTEDFVLFKQPSGISEEAENKEHLPDNYYEDMIKTAAISGKDNNWVNIHVHGNYGHIIDGKGIFVDYFNDKVHIAQKKLIPNYNYKIGIGVDFGLQPACVFAQLIDSKWHILGEITSEETAMSGFVELMQEYIGNNFSPTAKFFVYGDPAGQQRSQVDLKTAFSVIKAAGFNIQPSIQSPALRRESVIAALRREEGAIFDKSCKILIKGMYGGYKWKRIRSSDERYQSVPDKSFESHVNDAFQYLVSPFEKSDILYKRNGKAFPHKGQKKSNIVVENWSLYK